MEMRKLGDLLDIPKNWNGNVGLNGKLDKFLKQDTFLEFVEKLAILELLQEPFLDKYFINKESFPFAHEGFIGHETAMLNVFTFWNHYTKKYQTEMTKKGIISADKVELWQKEMGYEHHHDPTSESEE